MEAVGKKEQQNEDKAKLGGVLLKRKEIDVW